MKPWLVIPVKSLAHGKSRLSLHLSEAARHQLNTALLERSLALASEFPGIERTLVVSSCPEVIALAGSRGARTLVEKDPGLNQAVTQAVAMLADRGAPQLVMSCDLPLAGPDDLMALARSGELAIATDRHGAGTNALWLPARAGFRFQFGDASRYRHTEEARRHGWHCSVLQRPALAFDVDTIDDYRRWQRLERMRGAGPVPRTPALGTDASDEESKLSPLLTDSVTGSTCG